MWWWPRRRPARSETARCSCSRWNTRCASAQKRSAKKRFKFNGEARMANHEAMTNFECRIRLRAELVIRSFLRKSSFGFRHFDFLSTLNKQELLNMAKDKTPSDVSKMIKDHGVKLVDFKFTDLPGTWQHFT